MSTGYGPEANGLICGFLFAEDGTGRAIGLAEAVEWAEGSAQAGPRGFVWLHFSLTDASANRWMQSHLPLVPECFEAMREGSRSTRLEDAQQSLIAVVNDVAHEFSFDSSQIATLWASVGDRLMVSARISPLRSIDRLRQAVIAEARFASPVALHKHLLNDQGDGA